MVVLTPKTGRQENLHYRKMVTKKIYSGHAEYFYILSEQIFLAGGGSNPPPPDRGHVP